MGLRCNCKCASQDICEGSGRLGMPVPHILQRNPCDTLRDSVGCIGQGRRQGFPSFPPSREREMLLPASSHNNELGPAHRSQASGIVCGFGEFRGI